MELAYSGIDLETTVIKIDNSSYLNPIPLNALKVVTQYSLMVL